MTTAMTVSPASRANEIYAKIENPMTAIAELGKMFHQSQIMGVTTPGDGAVLALTCMCEGITPLEFAKTYHIINGKPSMRADMMAAKFRSAGGKIQWSSLGDDGKSASATFEYDGQSLPITYTIEDARNAVGDKVDKTDSNWRKDRGAMLRSRLITKAIRIMAPELIAGTYTPDEIEDVNAISPKSDVAAQATRREELLRSAVAVEPQQEVIDAEAVEVQVESPPFEAAQAEPVNDDNEPTTPELLKELAAIGTKLPSRENQGSAMGLKELQELACKSFKVDRIQAATRGQVRKLIARLRDGMSKVADA